MARKRNEEYLEDRQDETVIFHPSSDLIDLGAKRDRRAEHRGTPFGIVKTLRYSEVIGI